MDLRIIKSRLELAKGEKIKAEERLKILESEKASIIAELKKLDVADPRDIDKVLKSLEKELEGLLTDLEKVESDVLIPQQKEQPRQPSSAKKSASSEEDDILKELGI